MKKAGRLAILLLALSVSSARSWTPPEQADPGRILREARDDYQAGRLDDASAKHFWYHRNALAIDPAQSGVRLSFALSDWYRLAERHPPAMRDLLATRDAASKRLASNDAADAYAAFFELTRIQSQFEQWDRIQADFGRFAARHPRWASRALQHALPAMVEQRDARGAALHLDLEPMMQSLTDQHRQLSSTAGLATDQAAALQAFARKQTDLAWSRVVWVLVKANRNDEAARCAERGRTVLGVGVQTPFIDAALRGEAPPVDLRSRRWFDRLHRWLVSAFS